MLTDFTGADRVYIAYGYTDLRRGIDGLAALVQQQFHLDPFTNTLFMFCGRKSFVIDRKNSLFANTPKGAAGSAVMFSLIQTAIENGLDPFRYLTWLLKTANGADLSQEDMISSLLLWSAPVECRAGREEANT